MPKLSWKQHYEDHSDLLMLAARLAAYGASNAERVDDESERGHNTWVHGEPGDLDDLCKEATRLVRREARP